MAMTVEQQKEAARRILEKEPLTAEEQQTFELLVKRPGDYRVPGEKRVCGVCGARFGDKVDAKGVVEVSALQKFSDHMAEHNPSPARWATAHQRIEESRPAKGT